MYVSKDKVQVKDLRPGMENVSIKVRVLEVNQPKVIQTRAGMRTLSEAVVGDGTGRVKLTLWGRAVGKLSEGRVFTIEGAWVTVFKGKVQLNAGSRTEIKEVSDESFPPSSDIPESEPTFEGEYRPRSKSFPSRRSRRPFRGRRK
ncbi:MAG: single-stranded DNA-binding protein [Thermoprotei archaeon]|nr:MAG: single-stranded DNA-binding protein [Thermoprotei archaeon]